MSDDLQGQYFPETLEDERKNWWWDDNAVFDIGLSPHALLARFYLTRCANDGRVCFPSIANISAKTGMGKTSVKNALRELVDKGLLLRKPRFKEGSKEKQSTIYKILEVGRHTTEVGRQTANVGRQTASEEYVLKNTKEEVSLSGKPDTIPYEIIIQHLNQKAGRDFSAKREKTRKQIRGRYGEGRTLEDFLKVIDCKVSEWKDDKEWDQYLRPDTLFSDKNFEKYLNQAKRVEQNKENDPEPDPPISYGSLI